MLLDDGLLRSLLSCDLALSEESKKLPVVRAVIGHCHDGSVLVYLSCT